MIARYRPCLVVLASVMLGCSDGLGPDDTINDPPVVHAGQEFTCALGRDDQIRCWGWNNVGQLGDGTKSDRSEPMPIAGDLSFQSAGIHGAGGHSCAVTQSGKAYCWGENGFGQLGDGTTLNRSIPAAVIGNHSFTSVSAGGRFSCGVTDSGEVYCWGRGIWGQLGHGGAPNREAPVRVSSDEEFVSVQAGGGSNVCAITTSGDVYCWGLNWRGAVGTSANDTCHSGQFSLSCAKAPVQVTTADGSFFKSLAVGASFACGVLTDGRAVCWGSNTNRQLGAPTASVCSLEGFPDAACSFVPIEVDGANTFVSATAGASHACGITEVGQALCWGVNDYGQLGNGGFRSDNVAPGPVKGVADFANLSAGINHTCGVTRRNEIYCWGINDHFQLGNDTTLIGELPVLVSGGG